MAVYTIGDPHLSLGCDKPMDIFKGWDNHAERLFKNWRETVSESDTVALVGDLSWAMTLDEALPDFRAIDALPGRKILIKGNHDYWWSTRRKLDEFFSANGLSTLNILFNDAYIADGIVICGTRGWFYEQGAEDDDKVFRRECGRLEASLASLKDETGERVAFIHYPPISASLRVEPIISLLEKYGVKRCYYGHLHGAGAAYAFSGDYNGIHYELISADKLAFKPLRVV